MIGSEPELDELITALREDLPSTEDEARLRRNLVGSGLMIGAACVTHHVSGHLGLKAAAFTSKWAASYGQCIAWLEGLPLVGGSLASGVGAAAKGVIAATAVGVTVGSVVHFTSEAPSNPSAAAGASLPARNAASPGKEPGLQAADATTVSPPEPAPIADVSAPRAREPANRAPRMASSAKLTAQQAQLAPRLSAPLTAQQAQQAQLAPRLSAPPAAQQAQLAPRLSAPPAVDAHATGKHTPSQQDQGRRAAHSTSITTARATSPSSVVERQAAGSGQTSRGSRSSNTLPLETQLLERALLALRNEDVNLARRWLREHHERFPRGVLAPERQRLLARLDGQLED